MRDSEKVAGSFISVTKDATNLYFVLWNVFKYRRLLFPCDAAFLKVTSYNDKASSGKPESIACSFEFSGLN